MWAQPCLALIRSLSQSALALSIASAYTFNKNKNMDLNKTADLFDQSLFPWHSKCVVDSNIFLIFGSSSKKFPYWSMFRLLYVAVLWTGTDCFSIVPLLGKIREINGTGWDYSLPLGKVSSGTKFWDFSWKTSMFTSVFQDWYYPLPPRAFSQQPTLPHSRKLSAVIYVPTFQTAGKMTSRQRTVACCFRKKKKNC